MESEPEWCHQDARNWDLGLDTMMRTLLLWLLSLVSVSRCELASFSPTVSCVVGRDGRELPQRSSFGGNRQFFNLGKESLVLSDHGLNHCVQETEQYDRLPWVWGLLVWLGRGWGAGQYNQQTPPGLLGEGFTVPVRKRGSEEHTDRPKQRATEVHSFPLFGCLACAHTYTSNSKKNTLLDESGIILQRAKNGTRVEDSPNVGLLLNPAPRPGFWRPIHSSWWNLDVFLMISLAIYG